MGKVKRRAFLEELIEAKMETDRPSIGKEDDLFRKYANNKLPTNLAKTTSGIAAYAGPWTEAEAIHLLRRATFGVKPSDVQALLTMTTEQAVDALLNNVPPIPNPPVNNYDDTMYTDPTGILPGETWVAALYGDSTVDAYRQQSLKSWWTGIMVNQDLSIYEKMVYFWHNHFAIEAGVVSDARLSYNHYMLLRAHAMGNFKTLVRQMTTDPAMLIYLNGYLNVNYAPDENYARELQELFTVSKDYIPHYTEPDVQQAARVLTGWRINNSTLTSYFNPALHDTGNKQFSSYYGNAVINGQSGSAGANETNQLITMLFNKFETAKYICSKLYRFFVYYTIDTQ